MLNKVKVVWVSLRVLRAKNFNLTFNNTLVMSPIHEEVVEEVGLGVLRAG